MQRTIFILGLLLTAGCGPLTVQPNKPDDQDKKPAVVAVTRWTLFADSIDNPDTLPKNSTQLSLMLTHLRSLGRITDAEVAMVKACVPKIDEMETVLTKEVSDKIRGLK